MTTCTSVKPARARASTAVSPPTPCSGVSAIRRVRAVPRGRRGDPVEVGLADVDDPVRRRPTGTETAGGCGGDRGLDLGVRGRGELAPVVDVDLVAVVGGRVVRGGDLDAGDGADLPDREREHGGGQRAGQHPDGEPGAREHLGGGRGERLRPAAGVPADDDRRPGPALRAQPAREAGGRPADHGDVHAVRAGADRPAQPGRAELQRSRPCGRSGRRPPPGRR